MTRTAVALVVCAVVGSAAVGGIVGSYYAPQAQVTLLGADVDGIRRALQARDKDFIELSRLQKEVEALKALPVLQDAAAKQQAAKEAEARERRGRIADAITEGVIVGTGAYFGARAGAKAGAKK